MQTFRDILFASRGVRDETEALKQALSLARNNEGALTCLVACPRVPKGMAEYETKIIESLRTDAEEAIESARAALKMDADQVRITVDVEPGHAPDVRIVQRVLRQAHDLVVKDAEPREDQRGYDAFDMHLLRKCPSPVWLCRPISKSRGEIRVAVAIDPEDQGSEGHDLTLRLLTLARSLADTCSGELEIISCWECEYEGFLRQNPWGRVSEEQAEREVAEAREHHRAALQAVIGNTAENVLQRLRCSLVAMKPNGFVSPIKSH